MSVPLWPVADRHDYEDLDPELREMAWEHERRKRLLRVRAIIAAIVVVTLLALTVLPSIVSALRSRRPPTPEPTVVRALEV